jgi:hypothetical protein
MQFCKIDSRCLASAMTKRSLRRLLKVGGLSVLLLFVASFVFPELGPAQILKTLHTSLSRHTRYLRSVSHKFSARVKSFFFFWGGGAARVPLLLLGHPVFRLFFLGSHHPANWDVQHLLAPEMAPTFHSHDSFLKENNCFFCVMDQTPHP